MMYKRGWRQCVSVSKQSCSAGSGVEAGGFDEDSWHTFVDFCSTSFPVCHQPLITAHNPLPMHQAVLWLTQQLRAHKIKISHCLHCFLLAGAGAGSE